MAHRLQPPGRARRPQAHPSRLLRHRRASHHVHENLRPSRARTNQRTPAHMPNQPPHALSGAHLTSHADDAHVAPGTTNTRARTRTAHNTAHRAPAATTRSGAAGKDGASDLRHNCQGCNIQRQECSISSTVSPAAATLPPRPSSQPPMAYCCAAAAPPPGAQHQERMELED